MKKLKTLFCFAVATLLTGATAISNSNHNNKNVMNQNVEKIEEVQKEGEEIATKNLTIHYRRDDWTNDWRIHIWGNGIPVFDEAFTESDGYGRYLELDLSTYTPTDRKLGFIIYKVGENGNWIKDATNDDRFYNIPEEASENGHDIYLYNNLNNVCENDEKDASGTWYVQMMARNAIAEESTKAQLKYSFGVSTEGESTKYTFYNMKMNLGAIIPKTKIDDLEASRISIVEYGVALAKNTVLTKNSISITDAMIAKEKEARDNLTNGTTNNSYSYVNVVSKAYSGSDPKRFYYTDSSGVEKEGDHVIFNANLSFDNEGQFRYSSVTAVAYFKFDIKIDSEDKVYELFTFLNPKNCSIPSLAMEYVKSGVFSNFDQYVQGSLIALSEFKVD